jgi:hypothetical protein
MISAIATMMVMQLRPLEFPTEPISSELLRGEKIYYQHKGIERTLLEDRVAVGKWFDGKVKRDTDQVIWLSPSMVSRWLGYLNAKEKWSVSELLERWKRTARSLEGRLTFVAEFFALPKREDMLELTESGPSKPETALNLRFLLTNLAPNRGDTAQHLEGQIGEKKHQSPLDRELPVAAPIAYFKGYDLDSIARWPWFQLDPLFAPLSPSLASRAPSAYDGVVGDHLRAIYLIQANPPAEPLAARGFELRIFAPGKDLVARFPQKR